MFVLLSRDVNAVLTSSSFLCGLHNVCGHTTSRSDLFIYPRLWSACQVVSHTCTYCGPIFFNFGRLLYKTKTLVKLVNSRQSGCFPVLSRSRIMFELFSRDFKAILRVSLVSTNRI